VQDIPKWNGHNIIQCPQYKVTLMYIAPKPYREHLCLAHFFFFFGKFSLLFQSFFLYVSTGILCWYLYSKYESFSLRIW
jgi:hypothetical protein